MVRVTDYKLRQSHDGKDFFAIILQGGIEFVKTATGGSYLKANTVSIPTTFDEKTCIAMLGSDLPGNIAKIETEPYEFTIQDTGEVIILAHRYEYQEELMQTVDFTKVVKQSANGVHLMDKL